MMGSPHGFALGLVAAMIFLFPGGILCLFLLDFLRVNAGYVSILVAALPINILGWYAAELAITKIRSKKTG